MNKLKFLLAGILFGIALTKAQIVSWYRIYEMFRFESFHMYGTIGSAIVLGIIAIQIIKRFQLKDFSGNPIYIAPKPKRYAPAVIGGIMFGAGWAFTGACPGPIYILIGNGFMVFGVVLISAVLGTLVYGLVMNKLPQK